MAAPWPDKRSSILVAPQNMYSLQDLEQAAAIMMVSTQVFHVRCERRILLNPFHI